jgi:Flp pilus assembly protein CpaB
VFNFKSNRPKRLQKHGAFSAFSIALAISVAAAIFYSAVKPDLVESNSLPNVVVASNDDVVLIPTPLRPIAKGERIDRVPFARSKWPKSKLNMDYVKSIENIGDAVAAVSLPAHLPIPTSSLSDDLGDRNAVVDRIPSGMRAITIRVDAESAVEGWARPGDFVDIILLRNGEKADVGIEAKVIAENVRILSAGRSAEPLGSQVSAARAPATVTILVDQQDALKVKASSSIGKLTLALRGIGDSNPTLAKRMDQKTILGSSRAYLPRKKIYRGKATGPDGKTYLLSDHSQWIESRNKKIEVLEDESPQ